MFGRLFIVSQMYYWNNKIVWAIIEEEEEDRVDGVGRWNGGKQKSIVQVVCFNIVLQGLDKVQFPSYWDIISYSKFSALGLNSSPLAKGHLCYFKLFLLDHIFHFKIEHTWVNYYIKWKWSFFVFSKLPINPNIFLHTPLSTIQPL